MKIMIPAEEAREIEVCDFCKDEKTALWTCPVCHRQFCISCEGIIGGCVIQPDVCKKCARREDVNAIVDSYVEKLRPILDRRKEELAALYGKEQKEAE